jgi:hypothetical protein
MTSGFQVPNAVELRVSIDRIEPQIWRRLVVPSSFNLRDLHLVLQAAFGWMNTHLHEFEIGGLRFGDELADAERGPEDARTFNTREPGATFSYVYDMETIGVTRCAWKARCYRAGTAGGEMHGWRSLATAGGRRRPERLSGFSGSAS